MANPLSFPQVLEATENDVFDDGSVGGMSSDEEEDLDRELGLSHESSSDEEPYAEELTAEELTAEEDKDSDDLAEGIGGRAQSPIRKRARGASVSRGRARGGRGRGGNAELEGVTAEVTKSYDNPDINHNLPPFKPSRPPGINFDRTVLRGRFTTELEFFQLFFTPEIAHSVASHSNTYACMKILDGGYSKYTNAEGAWETCAAEVYKLVALLIYFGLVRVDSCVENYWSTKTLYHGLWARKILSSTCYLGLMAFLHVVDPGSEIPGDKLRKVDEFIRSFKERCHLLYQPRQNIAVDERMVKSKHISGIRQYMKDKPTKWGLKLWVLADSFNGYTLDFNVYIGKSEHEEISENGLGYDVVMKLVEPYLNQGYHVFFDNFYTSHKLVRDLFLNGTPSSGTVKISKVGFPKSLKDLKVWVKGKERGSMRWERESNVLTVQWIDNKPVSLLTTIDSANEKVQAKRRTKTKGKYQEISVCKPLAIHRYNQYMNGVDRSDQMLACHNVTRKCLKWWKTLFFHMIDIAVVNSFILFQEHRASNLDDPALQRKNTYSIVNFREAIIRQICGLNEYDTPPANERIHPVHDYGTVHMPEVSDAGRRNCVVCYASGRGEKKVSTYCAALQCQKFMHVGVGFNCFKEWHSRGYAGRK